MLISMLYNYHFRIILCRLLIVFQKCIVLSDLRTFELTVAYYLFIAPAPSILRTEA